MKKIRRINSKLSLLFIAAILILCAGFLIVSCGQPQEKTKNNNAGPYAVDFSRCPAGATSCSLLAEKDNIPDVSGELTIEAWVKRPSATAVNGGIFSRMDTASGVSLYVNNNEPKFAIRVATGASTTTPGVTGSVDYIVGSGFTLVQDVWTHIAGIVRNAVHSSHPSSTSCTPAAMAETPHMDIYVKGDFYDCATTWGNASDPATGPQFADNPGHHQLVVGIIQSGPVDTINLPPINAVVDEVRLWTTGREAADILACKNTELGIGGTCNRGDSKLAVYYRLNEGEEHDATDMSPYGITGSLLIFNPTEAYWEDGWVTPGAPISPAD